MRIGVIGFGNMAQAMIYGLYEYTDYKDKIYACAKNYDKLVHNTKYYPMVASSDAHQVIENSDIIIIAIKPYLVDEVITPLADRLKHKTILSIVAGYPLSKWQAILGNDIKCICTIPNTPIRVGKGIIIVDENHSLDKNTKDFIEELI